MSVAERGPGRMTYAKKKIKPFAEHDLRVTRECAGNKAMWQQLMTFSQLQEGFFNEHFMAVEVSFRWLLISYPLTDNRLLTDR